MLDTRTSTHFTPQHWLLSYGIVLVRVRVQELDGTSGKGIWAYMKINRDNKFIEWFEYEIYEREYFINEEQRERSKGLNTIRE